MNWLRARPLLAATVFSALTLVSSDVGRAANGSASYTYDALGRVVTTLYDTGICVIYSYDANGNRTSQATDVGGMPLTPTWGGGTWGCFVWTSTR